MKIFFGINVAKKDDAIMTGNEFIVKRASQENVNALDSSGEEAEHIMKKASIPTWLKVIKYVFGIIAAFVVAAIAGIEVSLEQAYKNAPYIFWIGGISLVAFAILSFIEHTKKNKVLSKENIDEVNAEINEKTDIIYKELNVPDDAPEVDILCVSYKEKNGEPTPSTSGLSTTPFVNFSLKLYVQDDMLCIADCESVYGIPLFEIRCIRTIPKRICIPVWNKDDKPNKGIYKQYKITTNQYGLYIKPYHILEFAHEGEIWQLYFPCYELPIFERLTGHTSKADDK